MKGGDDDDDDDDDGSEDDEKECIKPNYKCFYTKSYPEDCPFIKTCKATTGGYCVPP
jgi:hypothetical protein